MSFAPSCLVMRAMFIGPSSLSFFASSVSSSALSTAVYAAQLITQVILSGTDPLLTESPVLPDDGPCFIVNFSRATGSVMSTSMSVPIQLILFSVSCLAISLPSIPLLPINQIIFYSPIQLALMSK